MKKEKDRREDEVGFQPAEITQRDIDYFTFISKKYAGLVEDVDDLASYLIMRRWQANTKSRKIFLRSAIIDYLRYRGPWNRKGVKRPQSHANMRSLDVLKDTIYPDHDPLDKLEISEIMDKVLTSDEKHLILMRFWWGFNVPQLATEYGVSTAAIYMRLQKVYEKMKGHIEM